MSKIAFAGHCAGWLVWLACTSVQSAPLGQPQPEAQLSGALAQALWPADISRRATDYLLRYPDGPAAGEARIARERADAVMQVLGQADVRLYRTAFEPRGESEQVTAAVRRAALGDGDAALQLALWHQHGDAGLHPDVNRYVGWLQFASMLGHPRASYELALHYRRENQPVMAAKYEARAEELGFKAPVALDHVRK
jgi:TPR repeat protein